jgi:glutamine amidotransferase
MAMPTDPQHRLADCFYGGQRISAAVNRDHITGCQFHPEKSGEVGLKILRAFCAD